MSMPVHRCLVMFARLQTHMAPYSLTATSRSQWPRSTMLLPDGSAVFADTDETIFTQFDEQGSIT